MTDTTGGREPDEPTEPQPVEPVEPIAEPVPLAKVRPTNEELRGPRPAPSIPSLAGAAAGVFVVFGLFLLLGELGDDARLAGIGISLVFEVLGVVLLQFSKGRRSATAGGTIAAVAIIPLLGFLFIDTPGDTIETPNDVTGPVTAVLVVAALVWFCAWYFGPGRRYAFFLGAACLALWLAAQVQVVSNPARVVHGQQEDLVALRAAGEAVAAVDQLRDPARRAARVEQLEADLALGGREHRQDGDGLAAPGRDPIDVPLAAEVRIEAVREVDRLGRVNRPLRRDRDGWVEPRGVVDLRRRPVAPVDRRRGRHLAVVPELHADRRERPHDAAQEHERRDRIRRRAAAARRHGAREQRQGVRRGPRIALG